MNVPSTPGVYLFSPDEFNVGATAVYLVPLGEKQVVRSVRASGVEEFISPEGGGLLDTVRRIVTEWFPTSRPLLIMVSDRNLYNRLVRTDEADQTDDEQEVANLLLETETTMELIDRDKDNHYRAIIGIPVS